MHVEEVSCSACTTTYLLCTALMHAAVHGAAGCGTTASATTMWACRAHCFPDHVRRVPQVKPKKKKKPSKASVDKPLTQDEMLMQAAFTEIHNTR